MERRIKKKEKGTTDDKNNKYYKAWLGDFQQERKDEMMALLIERIIIICFKWTLIGFGILGIVKFVKWYF